MDVFSELRKFEIPEVLIKMMAPSIRNMELSCGGVRRVFNKTNEDKYGVDFIAGNGRRYGWETSRNRIFRGEYV